jgi:hypothetical protein
VETYDNRDQGFIEVWLTNAEPEAVDRPAPVEQLLAKTGHPKKCKDVSFLSGSADLTMYNQSSSQAQGKMKFQMLSQTSE